LLGCKLRLLFSKLRKALTQLDVTVLLVEDFLWVKTSRSSKDTKRNRPPLKRIKALYKSYQKVTDGTLIAQEIGLTKIREKCKLFNEWISLLEK
jgi:hypothetical protein